MGYSIATPVKSEKAKKEMAEFLSRHYNKSLDPYARGPLSDDLSYDHGPCRIGFDGVTTSDYMISVCAWIALKVGKPKKYPTKANPDVRGYYKYVRYDGFEDWPLCVVSAWRKGSPHLMKVSPVGCLVPRLRAWDMTGRRTQLKKIEKELKRLDALWESGQWRTVRTVLPP